MRTFNRVMRGALIAFIVLAAIVPSITAAPARHTQLASALGSVGTNSCIGPGACSGATGNIGNNSCNGAAACSTSTVNVGDDSCVGQEACYEDQGNIGNGSCNGIHACYLYLYVLSIGNYSCNGFGACNSATVGDCQNNDVTPDPCKPCPLGYWSGNGVGNPAPCGPADPGHYVDTTGATSQTACDPGYYQTSSGATSCLAADAGYYVPSTGATGQTPAAIGFYVDSVGANQQTACPAGQTTTSTASSSAAACFTPYVSPYARKQVAAAELQALLPTGSSNADNRLGRAIANINSSLASWRWTAADALNPAFGWRVFNFERHAVTWLWAGPLLGNPTLSAVANDAVNQLVAADREVVVKTIANSTDSAAIAKANAKLAQADALIATNQRAKAIYKLRAAWLAVN